jgi:hypothetical protein
MKSVRAIVGLLLLSALATTGCAVDDQPASEDEQLADPAGDEEIRETAPSAPSAATADLSSIGAAHERDPEGSLPALGSEITAHACRTTCRDVVRPELCLVIPFPFCLIPQHECVTLCDVP